MLVLSFLFVLTAHALFVVVVIVVLFAVVAAAVKVIHSHCASNITRMVQIFPSKHNNILRS
jgi:hypothetical protein